MKNTIFASLPSVALGVIIAIAPQTFAHACTGHSMLGACHYSQQAATGIGIVIALLGTVTAAFGGTSYTEAAGRQSLYTLTAAKARGTIYDRNLQPLTNAERVYVAAVIPAGACRH